ncbi:MAG: nitroreductase family protein [Prevotella sp.]|nr:nitroreductase family protein [Prevotella sp.]
MNFLEIVNKRFSCRSFAEKEVEKEKLDYVMECVRLAPSAVNKQPWTFRVIQSEEGKALMHRYYHREWFNSVPLYIVASVHHDEEWVRADGKHHGDIDVAIAVEHLCLAAAEIGLGTCWVCNFDAAMCKDELNMPDEEEPVVLIPVGYPACEVSPKKRKNMEDIVLSDSND